MRKIAPEIRFWFHVDKNGSNDCWLWTGHLRSGYGRFEVDRKLVSVHRFSYELVYGPIPSGLQLDHLCRVQNCVNPAHLEPVTQYENNMRSNSPAAIHARKTHCPRGHAFSLHGFVNTKGSRECVICRRDYAREYARVQRNTPENKRRAYPQLFDGDGNRIERTHCLYGHPYADHGFKDGRGQLRCYECKIRYNETRQLKLKKKKE